MLIADYEENLDAEYEELEEEMRIDPGASGLFKAHIPSFEINFEDSERLLDYIKTGEVVYLKATMEASND